MKDPKSTKLDVREDRTTAVSSTLHGSNVDAIGFNIAFLATRSPRLAIEVMKLYAVARNVTEADPKAPDEDLAMYAEELSKVLINENH